MISIFDLSPEEFDSHSKNMSVEEIQMAFVEFVQLNTTSQNNKREEMVSCQI